MRLPRVQFTVRRMMGAVALVAGSFAFGSGSDARYRSCHLCHNRERIDATTVWSVPITWRGEVTTRFSRVPIPLKRALSAAACACLGLFSI
jgi:hypothetical protein